MFQNVLKLAVKKSKFETSGVSGEYAEPPVKRPRLIGATKDPAIFNIDKDRQVFDENAFVGWCYEK